MKEYRVTMEQSVTGTLLIKADTKGEAKEVVEDLVDSNKMQYLIQDISAVDCEEWNIKSVEDY